MGYKFQFINSETIQDYSQMVQHDFCWPNWQPEVEYIDNATIVPVESFYDEEGNYKYRGGVLDQNGEFVQSSGMYKGLDFKKNVLSMAECPTVNTEDCIYIDEEVVYYGFFIYHWGHFLFESTNRLWYYLQENCKAKGIRLAGLFLNKKPDGNFQVFHELLGINKEDLLFIDRPIRFKRVIIPKASCVLGTARTSSFYYSKEFLIPFNIIYNSVPAGKSSKIYLTRSKLKDGNTIGENDIENNFKKNGFEIVAPENETLIKMVSLLKGAETVAGLSGSNTHNLLFTASQCKVIILNRMQGTNYPQELVHHARSLDAVYIDVYSTFMPVTHGNGPFLVSVNENLFNYQVMRGLIPYNYSSFFLVNDIILFLKKWGETYSDNSFAASALEIYYFNVKDFIEQFSSFFNKNKLNISSKLQKIKLKYWIFLHKYRMKKIYEIINTDKSRMSDLEIIRYSYYFNERWYRKKYMGFVKGTDPAEHYLYIGFKKGNDPSPRFSTNGYLELYQDISDGEINPLWHYEKHGKFEGRQIIH